VADLAPAWQPRACPHLQFQLSYRKLQALCTACIALYFSLKRGKLPARRSGLLSGSCGIVHRCCRLHPTSEQAFKDRLQHGKAFTTYIVTVCWLSASQSSGIILQARRWPSISASTQDTKRTGRTNGVLAPARDNRPATSVTRVATCCSSIAAVEDP
jgi:hypothetical protein